MKTSVLAAAAAIAAIAALDAALGGCASARPSDERLPETQFVFVGAQADSAPAPADRPPPAPERDVETVYLHVDGMTCPVRCPREIREMLGGVPGVLNMAVDVPSQTVVANVSRGTDPQTLIDAIKSPYRARRM